MYCYVNISFILWDKSPFVLKLYTVIYYHAYQAVFALRVEKIYAPTTLMCILNIVVLSNSVAKE